MRRVALKVVGGFPLHETCVVAEHRQGPQAELLVRACSPPGPVVERRVTIEAGAGDLEGSQGGARFKA
jgi:hypothetical protein